jgi:hypothetical protein
MTTCHSEEHFDLAQCKLRDDTVPAFGAGENLRLQSKSLYQTEILTCTCVHVQVSLGAPSLRSGLRLRMT